MAAVLAYLRFMDSERLGWWNTRTGDHGTYNMNRGGWYWTEDPVADMASGNEIDVGKPGFGVNRDIVSTVRNVGTANLVLEGTGPDYVSVVDQNEAVKPFTVLVGDGDGFS